MIYDNGRFRSDGKYTRVLELDVDLEARTAQRVWRYTETDWYDALFGDADRLPNGNVLITQGFKYTQAIVHDPKNRTSIIEVDPLTHDVVHRLDFQEEDDTSYRADRVDGCALFANRAYCQSLSP